MNRQSMYWHKFLSASTLNARTSMTRCTSSLRNEQGQAQATFGYLPAGFELLVVTHWLWCLEAGSWNHGIGIWPSGEREKPLLCFHHPLEVLLKLRVVDVGEEFGITCCRIWKMAFFCMRCRERVNQTLPFLEINLDIFYTLFPVFIFFWKT